MFYVPKLQLAKITVCRNIFILFAKKQMIAKKNRCNTVDLFPKKKIQKSVSSALMGLVTIPGPQQ
jgi:hypothetical protein